MSTIPRDYCLEAFIRDYNRLPSFERQLAFDRLDACKCMQARMAERAELARDVPTEEQSG